MYKIHRPKALRAPGVHFVYLFVNLVFFYFLIFVYDFPICLYMFSIFFMGNSCIFIRFPYDSNICCKRPVFLNVWIQKYTEIINKHMGKSYTNIGNTNKKLNKIHRPPAAGARGASHPGCGFCTFV